MECPPPQPRPTSHRQTDLLPGDPHLIPAENRTAISKGQGTADDVYSTQTQDTRWQYPTHMASTKLGSNTELKGLVFTGFALTTPEMQGGPGGPVCPDRRQSQVCHLLADQAEEVLRPVQGCRLSRVNISAVSMSCKATPRGQHPSMCYFCHSHTLSDHQGQGGPGRLCPHRA